MMGLDRKTPFAPDRILPAGDLPTFDPNHEPWWSNNFDGTASIRPRYAATQLTRFEYLGISAFGSGCKHPLSEGKALRILSSLANVKA